MPVELNRAPKMPTGAERHIQRIEIEPSDNGGASVKCYMKPPKTEKGDVTMPYMEPKLATFEDVDSAIEYARKKLGGAASDYGDEAEAETTT